MQQSIVAFQQDEEQHWVAKLACGHSQHVRHDPPWQSRPWVTTDSGRKKMLGATLQCNKCDMPKLPTKDLLVVLNTSTKISEKTFPPELLSNDLLPDNIWAEIVIVSGQIQLIFDDSSSIKAIAKGFLLDSEYNGVTPPQTAFRLKPCGPVEFHITLYERETV